jgi:hypothetical protein
VATLALVGVTYWYALLTRRMVAAQDRLLEQARHAERQQVRRERERVHREALVAIWRASMSTESMLHWPSIREAFRRFEDPNLSQTDAREAADELQAVADCASSMAKLLVDLTPDLPREMTANAQTSIMNLMHVTSAAQRLVICVLHEFKRSDTDAADFDMGRISNEWTLEFRVKTRGVEWAELVSSSFLDDYTELQDRVEAEAFIYAQRALQADQSDTQA